MLRILKRLILLLIAIYALGCLYLYVEQRTFIYHGGNEAPAADALAGAGYKKVTYQASDGQGLWGFYRPSADPAQPVLLVLHGNTGIKPIIDDRAVPLSTLDAGVFIATYRGFEGNTGEPSEDNLGLDAQAAVDYLGTQGIEPKQIILYGHSLGTGVAVDEAYKLAAQHAPVDGLILEAPFSSMVSMAAAQYWFMPTGMLLKDRFDSINRIADVKTPVLILHGDADKTIPQSQARTLCDKAQLPKTCIWISGGGHADLYKFGVLNDVKSFVMLASADDSALLGHYDQPLTITLAAGKTVPMTVELALTPAEQETGMMFRTRLADDQGMLFVFPTLDTKTFWMKNTELPLDIIFIDTNGKITHIAHDAQPNDESLIPSGGPVQFVLEIKGGMAARMGIAEGDIVRSPSLGLH